MPVHLYGQTADMDRDRSSWPRTTASRVVEDAAQAHGAPHDGRAAGSFGLGCFSFYATKNLTTGEGGMITTDDDALADRLRVLRNQGMRERYEYEVAGHNYRMTDLQAALAHAAARAAEQIIARGRRTRAPLTDGPGRRPRTAPARAAAAAAATSGTSTRSA